MSRLISVLVICLAAAAWIIILNRHVGDRRPPVAQNGMRRANPALRRLPVTRPREERIPVQSDPTPVLPENPAPPIEKTEKPPEKPAEKKAKSSPQDDLFAGSLVPVIQLEIPRAGINALRQTHPMSGQARPTVKAMIREGDRVLTNVALHLKGAAGSFRQVDDQPCFTLNVDKFAPGQSFHGLDKFSLNNSVQDPSLLSEKISRELFDAAGVPVPRAAHARVILNGRDLGLYVLTEGFNKKFLKRYFKNTKGNLFDGGFCQEINGALSVNSGDNPRDRSGLIELFNACQEPNAAQRLARLEQALDVDRFLSFVAMDMMLCNWDGYAMNRNNWRVFHDLDSNKMVFMPHGLDQMFGIMRANAQYSVTQSMRGMVARAVVGTPEGRRRYLERISQLSTNVYKVDEILKRVDEANAVIRPVLAESYPHAIAYHDQEVRRLKSRITRRGEYLNQQLSTPENPTQLVTGGSLALTDWKPSVQNGSPNMRLQRDPDGGSLLYIGATRGGVMASWRTRVTLEEGTYQFLGKIRTKDIRVGSGDYRAGGELRISRGTIPQGLNGTIDWRMFAYPFRVQDGGAEVEFVCELRAVRGEVWFDPASLRLVRSQ